jgi:secreted protein with Ig-like and vWFA domain
MPTDEGGKSRLANVVAALNARLQALPQNSAVGLWTFDGTAGRSEVSTGPLSDPLNGQPRSAALTSALNSQTASGGGAVSFTTLRILYDQTKANYRQGQNNSILLITTGPHTDQSLDGNGLQQYIRGAFDQARPVAVNVIDFGSDSDRATWEAVAQASGGSYQNLASSAGPDLTTAVTQFLG